MTPSLDRGETAGIEVPVPGGLSSMWRLLKLCYGFERQLMVRSLAAQLAAALPRPLTPAMLWLLTQGTVQQRPRMVFAAVAALALAACLSWLFSVTAERMSRRFRDRLAISVETHVARLQATIETLEHHERPEYLDRLAVLRRQVFMLDHLYTSIVITASWIFQLAVVVMLIATIDPVLSLVVVFAVPIVVAAVVRPAAERRSEERAAPHRRLADHLFSLGTSPAAGKDVRLAGVGVRLARARGDAWRRWYRPMIRARVVSQGWNAVAWAVFALGYGLALFYAIAVAGAGPAAVVLMLSAGLQLSDYLAEAVTEVGFLRGVFLDSARRLAWLEDYARAVTSSETVPAPQRLHRGIALENVSFTYPGASAPAVVGANLLLPAGTVVALVGENGAGKSTLVKLLGKFYSPTSGRIMIDDVPLDEIATDTWRRRVAGAFQDFATFEFPARISVGLGDLPMGGQESAVRAAVSRGGADTVIESLPGDLDTQLGARWPAGVDLSFGQWQKVALSRGFMRTDPLLVLLDEPSAALDAETEHALYERMTAAASTTRTQGRVTVLVSHRFSTVRMADLIVVLDGGGIAEVGDHCSLMERNGIYATLFRVQQRAYASGEKG